MFSFSNILNMAKGVFNNTIFAAIGLVGLGLFQLSQADYINALQSFIAAAAAFGLKSGIDNNTKMLMVQHEVMMSMKKGDNN